ncbi:MAG: hypothetical protein AB9866_18470 [Syntrophobacteraceae bacterium]
MRENRRKVRLNDRQSITRREGVGFAAQDDLGGSYARLTEIMETQLQLQNQIAAAQRERQTSVEKIREQEEIVRESAEKNLQQLHAQGPEQKALEEIQDNARAAAQAGTAFEKMRQSGSEFIDETGSGLTKLFRNNFKSELNSADKLWDSFCKSLLNSFSKTVAKIASSWLENIVGSIFGSTGTIFGGGGGGEAGVSAEIFHSGGVAGDANVHRMTSPILFAGAPRLHSGLAPDEFPAILQKGERVIPRGDISPGASAQYRAPRVSIVVNDYSNQGISADEKQVTWDPYENVLSVVIEASERDPRFHDAIKRANQM